jgi:hypothetical protein
MLYSYFMALWLCNIMFLDLNRFKIEIAKHFMFKDQILDVKKNQMYNNIHLPRKLLTSRYGRYFCWMLLTVLCQPHFLAAATG